MKNKYHKVKKALLQRLIQSAQAVALASALILMPTADVMAQAENFIAQGLVMPTGIVDQNFLSTGMVIIYAVAGAACAFYLTVMLLQTIGGTSNVFSDFIHSRPGANVATVLKVAGLGGGILLAAYFVVTWFLTNQATIIPT